MLKLTDPEAGSREHGYVRAALEGGSLIVVPTDTIYGLAARAYDEAACARLYEVKGRDAKRPTAVLFPSLDDLADALNERSRRARIACEALLPGPVTLIIGNTGKVVPWLCGETPEKIGVRVPRGAMDLPPLAATSANFTGDIEISQLSDLPPELYGEIACAVDRGVLPAGQASTVIDLTVWEDSGDVADVVVLRDPAGRAPELVGRLAKIS